MKFSTALNWMKGGQSVKAPGFKGYWFWDDVNREVIIVDKNNNRSRMKDTRDWDFTLGFINSDEWEIYDGPHDPRERKEP